MVSNKCFLTLSIFFINFRTLVGDLTISGVECGQKKCRTGEYCSQFDKQCIPCESICSQDHNFNEKECVSNCQDYLHDIRYLRRNQSSLPDRNLERLKDDVNKLSHLVTITLTLVCFMFLVLAAVLGFQLYRWKIKKNVTLQNLKDKIFKKSEAANDVKMEDSSTRSPNTPKGKSDLRLDISNVSTVSEHSPVTAITSISTRRPAEDSALDYAYDNHALSPSPK